MSRLDRVVTVGLEKRYERRRVLIDVDLELGPGLTALLGPNGAGKSTLLALLAGLARPSRGRVTWSAGDLELLPAEARAQVGYLGHEPGVYGELTAVENLELFAALSDVADPRARARAVLAEVGLEPDLAARPAAVLSRGAAQRLGLARALVADPALLLLDEPHAGLDVAGAAALRRVLGAAVAAGRVVVVVSHDLAALDGLCTAAVVLRGGRVAARRAPGTPLGQGELRDLLEART
jgi:heme ABC exporter ATP-binding subunit CcmA